jgi:hypothetical protein
MWLYGSKLEELVCSSLLRSQRKEKDKSGNAGQALQEQWNGDLSGQKKSAGQLKV